MFGSTKICLGIKSDGTQCTNTIVSNINFCLSCTCTDGTRQKISENFWKLDKGYPVAIPKIRYELAKTITEYEAYNTLLEKKIMREQEEIRCLCAQRKKLEETLREKLAANKQYLATQKSNLENLNSIKELHMSAFLPPGSTINVTIVNKPSGDTMVLKPLAFLNPLFGDIITPETIVPSAQKTQPIEDVQQGTKRKASTSEDHSKEKRQRIEKI